MRGEVVGPGERPHAYPALEWLLSGVYANVPGELVRPREPPVAAVHRACVGALVDGRLGGAVRVLPRPDVHQADGQLALLVDLAQDLVALARAGVVLCQRRRRGRLIRVGGGGGTLRSVAGGGGGGGGRRGGGGGRRGGGRAVSGRSAVKIGR